jgi:phosphatidylinositol alpha-1,6-mannosyltransferase
MRRLRIVLFAADFKPLLGGVAEHMHNLALEFRKRHDITVLAPAFPGWEEFDKKQPYAVVRYKNTLLRRTLLSYFDLRRLVRALRPDVVLNAAYFPEGLISYQLSRTVPFAYTVQTHAVEVVEGHGSLAQRIKRRMRWLRLRIFRESLVTFSTTPYTKGKLVGIGVPSEHVVVVPSAVPKTLLQRRAPKRYPFPKGTYTLLTVARLMDYKGVDMVLRALALVRAKHPNVRYVVVGKGPEEERLKTLAHELDVSDIVEFMGAVDEETKQRLYASCDCFIMCSRAIEERPDVEGFGLTFLEAHIYRKPVIGGNSGGIPYVVQDGKTGLLADPWKPGDIAAKISWMIEHPAAARRFGIAGRKRVESDLTWDKTVAALEKEILARLEERK